MKKEILLILFLLSALLLFGQKKINIQGLVKEKNKKTEMQSATVIAVRVKDSVVIAYTNSDKLGFFLLEVKRDSKPFYLKISYLGFKTFEILFDDNIENKNLGIIYLEEGNKILDEVVIKKDIPPIRIKKDTLEYNLKSFNIRKNISIGIALKQLPGLFIDSNNKITVNGKEVGQILVNGKPFFDADGKIALKNIPSEIIDKVQVTDLKTKSKEFLGDVASSDKKSINLTIKEDNNKGKFGNATLGFGNNNSAESNLFFNYFNDETKISLLQSSNTISTKSDIMLESIDFEKNQTAQIMNDNLMKSENNTIGLNYQDKLFKNIDISGSYAFTNAENISNAGFTKTNLLSSGNRITNSKTSNFSKSNNHTINFSLGSVIDSTSELYFTPRIASNNSKSSNQSFEGTKNVSNTILNNAESETYTDSKQISIGSNFLFNKRFKSKSILEISYDSEITQNNIKNGLNSNIKFINLTENIFRNQQSFDDKNNSNNIANVNFAVPISDSLRLSFKNEFKFIKNKTSLKTLDFDASNGKYSIFNMLQSFDTNSELTSNNFGIALNLNKEKINAGINIGSQFISFKNDGFYNNKSSLVNKKYVYPKLNFNFSYTISKTKSFSFSYDFDVNLPTNSQLLPIENISNPLYTIVGNEFLNPEKKHNFYLNYNYFKDDSFFSFNTSGGITLDNIVESTLFDENSKSTTTYQNVSENKNLATGLSWNKLDKREKFSLQYTSGLSATYSQNLGLTNNVLFSSNVFTVGSNVSLSLIIDEICAITPSYQFNFSSTTFKNSVSEKFENVQNNFRFDGFCTLFKNVNLEADLSYLTNKNAASGYQNNIYLLNSSIAYNFWKDRFSLKLKVFDILNKNQNTQREITNTAIIDRGNSALSRYGIISLTYNLKLFKSD